MSSTEAVRARFDFDRLRPWLPLFTLVGLMLVVGVTQPEFLTPSNLIELAGDTATLFVLAAGVSFTIMLGGIDLSIQAMASLASVLIALTIGRIGYGSFVLALLVGALSGWAGGMAHVEAEDPLVHRHPCGRRRVGGRRAGDLARTLDHAQRGRARLSLVDHRRLLSAFPAR